MLLVQHVNLHRQKGEIMTNHSFLLVHGLGGSGPQHWQTWLYQQLTERGIDVHYPTFSDYDNPDKDVWLKELQAAIDKIPAENRITVLAHSCGCSLWLHYAASAHVRKVEQAILVAPPSPFLDMPELTCFYPLPLIGANLSKAADHTFYVHSLDDPYCSIDDMTNYLKLGFPAIVLPKMGHINTASGHGPWPWILDICLTGKNPASP